MRHIFVGPSPRLTGIALGLAAALSLGGCIHKDAEALRIQAEQMRQQGQFKEAVITLKNALAADPASAVTRYQLARAYLDTGEALSAEKEARQALRDGYDRENTLAVLGRSLVLQGEYKKVLAEVDSVGPKTRSILPVRADALLALGQRDQARALFTALNSAEPRNTEALIGLGRIAYMDGDQDKAMVFADRILAVEPNNTDALMFKADLLRALNKGDQAVVLYDRVLALSPEHRTARIEKAYLAVGLGRFAEAQAELNKAAQATPNSMLVAYTQALLAYSQNKPAVANESLQRVLRVAPDHMPSVLLAGAVGLKLGNYFQAEQHFRHYLERNPGNLYARKMLAESLLGAGNTDAAVAVLDAALKEKGDDAQLLALAGESNLRIRKYDAAAELFEKAVALDPASASMHTSLGLTRLAKGDQQGAVDQLQKAADLDGGSVQAITALIRTEQRLGHYERAMAAVERLEKRQPRNALVYELKGLVFVDMKDAVKARANFRRALEVDPGDFAAVSDLVQLDLQDGKPEQARKDLDDFLDHNKSSTEAMTAQAALADMRHQPKEATAWLERAVAAAPHAIGPSASLVAQYLRTGDNAKALTLAQTMRVEHPENPDLLDLLARSQLANGNRAGALDSYKQMQKALPRSAPVLMQVASLHLLSGNVSQAEDELKGVLAMQPDFPSAQVELARLYVRKGAPDLALLMASTLQRQYPKGAAATSWKATS